MQQAERSFDEEDRLAALSSMALLDTPPEPAFDSVVQLAHSLFGASMCLVSLVDGNRQWFKARFGLDVSETARDISFCTHTIQGHGVLVVRDATQDSRFSDNPLVIGEPGIRFYAGAPIRVEGHHAIGTVCIADSVPRPTFSDLDAERLAAIAKICADLISSRAEEAQSRRLLDQLPLGIVLRQRDGQIIDVNPAFAAMVDRPRDALRGVNLDAITPNGRVRADEAMSGPKGGSQVGSVAGGSFGPFEAEVTRADGTQVPIQIRGLLIERGAKPVILSVVEDITERRKNEQELAQAQKMEAIGQLTGGLAHDFNNMLGVIIGNLDLLERELGAAPTGPAQGRLETARMAALRGADLTRALLSVARRQSFSPEPVDLNVRLKELVPLIQHTMGGSIDVVVDLDDEPMVNVDSSGLAGAILNLAINARDAMPNGGRLTLRTRLRSILYDEAGNDLPPGSYVAMSVTDTGVGMSHDVMNRAADPFFTTKAPGRGTGLGLAMAKGFAKQSAGEFRIYSELGHGTSITFLLPLTSRGEKAIAPLAAPRGGDERVLVVDDELELLAVTATWLKDLGYDVTPCASSRSALSAIADAARDNRPYRLLVTDVIMPGMNGFALANACRTQIPSLRVLYVSGFADAADRSADQLEGELVQKPFRQIELAIAARRALDGRLDAGAELQRVGAA